MKRVKRLVVSAVGACATTVFSFTGCDQVVLENVVAGLEEGTVTAATGIIEGFFMERFGLEGLNEGGEEDEKDGGNDLFVRL